MPPFVGASFLVMNPFKSYARSVKGNVKGSVTGGEGARPGSPLVDLLRYGEFAAVAVPGNAVARSINSHAKHYVAAGGGIRRDLEGHLEDADQVGRNARGEHGSSPIVHADDYLAESQRVGAGVRKRTGNHRWSCRSETSHVDPDRFTGSRRVLQADEAAVGADDHGAANAIAHHRFQDARDGGPNPESDGGRSAGDIDGDGDGVADSRFAGDLEGELFRATHVAHAVDGRGDIIHRDLRSE